MPTPTENVLFPFVLSPDTLAALQRLVAILLALIDALEAPVDGAPRSRATRLAISAFSAYLNRLATHLTDVAGQTAADPVAASPATRPRPIRARPIPAGWTPLPPIVQLPPPPALDATPLHAEIERPGPPPLHVQFITIS